MTLRPSQKLCVFSALFALSACSPVADSDGGMDASRPLDGSLNDSSVPDAGPTDGDPAVDSGPLDGSRPPVDGGRTWPSQCFVCHGSGAIPAPPLDTLGNEDTTFAGVGAHRRHMEGDTTWHRPVLCDDCHRVPSSRDDVGHRDTVQPAELTWGLVASSDGSTPIYDYDTTTCSGVYCHGGTLIPGGTNTTPNWTEVGTGQAACGTCHEIPPAPPHPANRNCFNCHPTVDDAWNFIEPERHINGVVDLVHELSCTSCHGSDGNPAPPNDVSGNSDTTARGVGAHRSHIGPSTWHREVTCSACHLVPGTETEPGHRDSALPAELTWGSLSTTDGAAPMFDGATTTCSGVYCHGETLLPGGSNTTPNWTRVGADEASCGTCHGLPPSAPHPANPNCSNCHTTIAADRSFPDPSTHIDGVVQAIAGHRAGWAAPTAHGAAANNSGIATCQGCHGAALDGGTVGISCASCHPAGWQTDCTFCHGGTLTTTGEPPEGIDGETRRDALAVGAHNEHMRGTHHAPGGCDQCHVVPTSALSPGHIDGDGRAEVTFGPFNPTATYDGSSGTCGTITCHGGGSMVWTDDLVLECTSCHAF